MQITGAIKKITVENEHGGGLTIKIGLEATVVSSDLELLGDLMRRPVVLNLTPQQADFLDRFSGKGGPNDGAN